MQEKSSEIVIVGYSGHSYVVIETIMKLGLVVEGYLDKQEAQNNPYNLEYLGFEDEDKIKELSSDFSFVLGIGDNVIRSNVASKIASIGGTFSNVSHPSAIVSESALVGDGVFVSSRVVINSLSEIGSYSIINTGAIVEHECLVGKGVHIAPAAILLGNVKVGDRSFIGSGSVLKQGIQIGPDVIIGAGSTVINDIHEPGTFVGNPARKLS